MCAGGDFKLGVRKSWSVRQLAENFSNSGQNEKGWREENIWDEGKKLCLLGFPFYIWQLLGSIDYPYLLYLS